MCNAIKSFVLLKYNRTVEKMDIRIIIYAFPASKITLYYWSNRQSKLTDMLVISCINKTLICEEWQLMLSFCLTKNSEEVLPKMTSLVNTIQFIVWQEDFHLLNLNRFYTYILWNFRNTIWTIFSKGNGFKYHWQLQKYSAEKNSP